jgi:hypothetical protein
MMVRRSAFGDAIEVTLIMYSPTQEVTSGIRSNDKGSNAESLCLPMGFSVDRAPDAQVSRIENAVEQASIDISLHEGAWSVSKDTTVVSTFSRRIARA